MSEIAGARRVRLVLDIKRHDARRKFHADNVRLRMLTTYLGPGTEWLSNGAVDRAVLEEPPDCRYDANRMIIAAPDQVRRARRCARSTLSTGGFAG